jgi:hypothetical protein
MFAATLRKHHPEIEGFILTLSSGHHPASGLLTRGEGRHVEKFSAAGGRVIFGSDWPVTSHAGLRHARAPK